MKRDLDLVRDALLFIESDYGASGHANSPTNNQALLEKLFEKFEPDLCVYNLDLLVESKLVSVEWYEERGGRNYRITGISWSGHEYLDTVRDLTVWNRVKEKIKKNSGAVSLSVTKKIAEKLVIAAMDLA